MTLSRTVSGVGELPTGFFAIGGSIAGRDHQRARRDGQDGFALLGEDDLAAAIVTDGCSSGRSSEVGARIGAAWIAQLLRERFPAHDPAAAARDITAALVERLSDIAQSIHGPIEHAVSNYLLFGFLAAVVTREAVIVFGVGDGTVWIDGRITVVDPGPNNAPIYPAYALLGADIQPVIHHVDEPRHIDAIAVATDGVEESVSSIDALVRDESLLRNPSLLRKRLIALQNQGRFWDDATIGIVRRTP